MGDLQSKIAAFCRDERGLEAIEFAIVAGIIVVGIIAAITAVSGWLASTWGAIRAGLGA